MFMRCLSRSFSRRDYVVEKIYIDVTQVLKRYGIHIQCFVLLNGAGRAELFACPLSVREVAGSAAGTAVGAVAVIRIAHDRISATM